MNKSAVSTSNSSSSACRSKISSAHDWKTEVNPNKSPRVYENYDAKKMQL
jgi:hypothetical protein